ncbi:hypothetical protein AB6A40_004921 [Gnathostoma spinigerum]|uniref:arginine kinase n=1 Tax=Gnathostoma spinigerum TaxID=75299 RepID=A0ABD6ENG1_9BILA
MRPVMAFLRNSKSLFGGLLATAAGVTAFAYFYPYNRDLVLMNLQMDEADAFTVKKIEESYKVLRESEDCHSLLKKALTEDILDELKYKKTKLGATLYDVIRSGISNLDASVGVYAPDAESYKTFGPLFDRIIEEYHGFPPSAKQPCVDLGEDKVSEFPPLDPDNKYILSTRIRCGRTLKGYPFQPLLTQDDYKIMEEKIVSALDKIKDEELRGKYYPLDGMSKEDQEKLIADHFLFKEGDRHLYHAKATKYWPRGRGIYFNNDKNFLIWVNEEDHLRIISMQNGSAVGEVLNRLIRGLKEIESSISFARDERLGFLTFCPTNLGSTIRASVHIRLPNLSKDKNFKKICEELNLQVRGVHGEHSESEGGVYDVSNKARLGISEVEAVRQMYDGVKELIRMEKERERK